MKDKNRERWGPLYLNEIRSPEYRSLSNGARELWVALTARTRSAGTHQASKKGFFVAAETLSMDLARPVKELCFKNGEVPAYVEEEVRLNKKRTAKIPVCQNCGGKMMPVSIRTIGRYLDELKRFDMVEVCRNTGPARIALYPPPSVVENLRKSSGKPMEPQPPNVGSIRHPEGSDPTPMNVGYSKPDTKDQIHTSSDDGRMIKRVSDALCIYHRVGNVPAEAYRDLNCESWAQVAVVAPQVLRPMFRSISKELTNPAFDDMIRKAGKIACTILSPPVKTKVGK